MEKAMASTQAKISILKFMSPDIYAIQSPQLLESGAF